jgi:hypothetical protein
MQSPSGSARVGASISVLGAVLIVSSDFIMSGIHPASLGPQVLWLVIPPALIILGISALACSRKLPRWLLVLNCGVSILGFLLQLLIYIANLAFACFDVCTPENTTIGSWILLGLGGFLLSGIGAFVTLSRS